MTTTIEVSREAWADKGKDALTRSVSAYRFFSEAHRGSKRDLADLNEAFSRSDFPILLSKGFDIEVLSAYREIEPEWRKVAAPSTVRDFKPKKFIELFGGREAFDPVAEGEEYKARDKDEAEYQISVGKFGNTFGLTFELRTNDEYDGLASLPADLAQGARNTEDRETFSQLVTEQGPNPAFFNDSNGNAPVAAPLSQESLKAAYKTITSRRAKGSNLPVNLAGERLLLVVPPALEFEAELLVNTPTIEVTEGKNKYQARNPLHGKFEVVVSYWAAVLNTSPNVDTTWYVTGAPTNTRPALVTALMRGHETPDIRVDDSRGQRVGGGEIPADEGSFKDDTIWYRGRHIVGAATLDPITTYASTGAASGS
jgi:hypothetical protein